MTGSVVLVVGGERFTCDRQILQHSSPYFEAMFSLDMKEKEANEIEMHDIEPSIFSMLLDFACEKEVDINSENAIPLLRASSLFQFDAVRDKCCEFLFTHLTIENCISAWNLGEVLGLPSLHSHAKKFILYEFSNLINGRDFLQLPLKLLVELLSYDLLNCANEMVVFDSIVRWTEYNQVEEIISLLLCIRYRSLTKEELAIIREHHLINRSSENKLFLQLLMKQLVKVPSLLNEYKLGNIFSLETLEEKVAFAVRVPPRCPFFSPLIIGRQMRSEMENHIQETFTPPCLLLYSRNRFRQLEGPLPINNISSNSNKHFYHRGGLCGSIGCLVGNDLYIFGGEYKIGSGLWNKDIWKCNLLTGEWHVVGTMKNPRRHCLVTVIGDIVYLIGGFGRFRKRLTSVETYNTKTGKWEEKAQIPNPVESSAAVTYEGKIYVFSTPSYMYDPNEVKWIEIPWKDIGFSSAFTFRNQIYVVTRQNPAVLLHFTVYNTFKEEFVFPSNVVCGCIVGDIFYGFNSNIVIALNLSNHSYTKQLLQNILNTETCCAIPNYSDI